MSFRFTGKNQLRQIVLRQIMAAGLCNSTFPRWFDVVVVDMRRDDMHVFGTMFEPPWSFADWTARARAHSPNSAMSLSCRWRAHVTHSMLLYYIGATLKR